MNIVMTLAGPSMRASYALGVRSGHECGLRPLVGGFGFTETPPMALPVAGEWFGSQPAAARPRPDAVSILDPHAASAPLGWSP